MVDREEIRRAIATDLRGKPSRNPDSLMPEIARQLGVPVEDVVTQVHQMSDSGHIVPVGQSSIRLSEDGERFYFSTNTEQASYFLANNWPYITSNVIALFALGVSILAYLKV